jgi:hypothetical protein
MKGGELLDQLSDWQLCNELVNCFVHVTFVHLPSLCNIYKKGHHSRRYVVKDENYCLLSNSVIWVIGKNNASQWLGRREVLLSFLILNKCKSHTFSSCSGSFGLFDK